MKEIAQRVWREPAVFIGLLTSIAVFVIVLLGDSDWSFDTIITVLAPILSSLGIRQAVYSPATVEELTKPPQGTTYRPKV